MDDLLNDFLLETAEALPLVEAELVAFEADPSRRAALNAVFRAVHTMKGGCGFLRLPRLEALAHAAETLLARLRVSTAAATPDAMNLLFRAVDGVREIVGHLELVGVEPAGEDVELIRALESAAQDRASEIQAEPVYPERRDSASKGDRLRAKAGARDADEGRAESFTRSEAEGFAPEPAQRAVRVDVEVLDSLSAGVSELARTRDQLLELLPGVEDAALRAPLQRLSVITGELQDEMTRARLQPIGGAWRALPRAVRDLSVRLGKDVDLQLDGGSAAVDREVVEALKEPLAHLLRNAADHGLEPAAERLAAGKPARGVLKLAAWTEDDALLVRVSDDGRGLDTDAIRYAAVADGWLTPGEAAALTEAQAHRLVFVPGLTTADDANAVSGRGVGLDAVRAAVERLGGRISIRSAPGRGTSFTLRIPLASGEAAMPESSRTPAAAPVWAPTPEPPPEAAPAPRRLLLIEGSAFLRNMMTPLLAAAGYEVTPAASTDDAWRLHAGGSEFDAIVTDLDGAGEAFARRLEDSRWSAAPRIALTDLPPSETPAPGYAEVVRKSDRQGLIQVLSGALGPDRSAERAA